MPGKIVSNLDNKAIEIIKNDRRGRLLDLGSGAGGLAKKARAAGFEVVAFDIDAERLATISSEQSANFTQTTSENIVRVLLSNQTAEFTQSSLGGIIQLAEADIIALFTQIASGGFVKLLESQVSAVFIQTAVGQFYWDVLPDGPDSSTQEAWVEIVPTGGT